jgi:bacterioferritin-associated ferredoxin
MIVCLCHRISDRDIVQAALGGTTCFEQLQDDTGLASRCGCCYECAREVFASARAGVPAARVPIHVPAATSRLTA